MSVVLILCAIVYMGAFFVGSIIQFSDSSTLLRLISIRGFMLPKVSLLFIVPILVGCLMIAAAVYRKHAAQIVLGIITSLVLLLVIMALNVLGAHLMHLVRFLFEYLIPAEYRHLEQQIQVASGKGLVCMLISSVAYTVLSMCSKKEKAINRNFEKKNDEQGETGSSMYDEF